MRTLYTPVRLNFLGSWSDQPGWPHPAVVVNASVGWNHRDAYSPYPLLRTADGFTSAVEGIGTGLGISSIRAAADFLFAQCAGAGSNEYIFRALEWERQNGTKGGWQDQIGAIEPGLKCITTSDHQAFGIQRLDGSDLFPHLVLFDTQIRRPAKAIGDKVRALFADKKFASVLRANVDDARHAHQLNTEQFAKLAVEGWRRLVTLVPEMETPIPALPGTWGTMLMGAGGGGFGVAFLTDPDNAPGVRLRLESFAMRTYLPVMLDGIRICDDGS